MADLEAVLADVSYLMAMEKSRGGPAIRARASQVKKMQLPDPSIRKLMIKYLTERGKIDFSEIFDQEIGYRLFKEFCTQSDLDIPHLLLHEELLNYKSLDTDEEKKNQAKLVLNRFIPKSGISSEEVSQEALNEIREKVNNEEYPVDLFQVYDKVIRSKLQEHLFDKFLDSVKFTRYLQWKNVELNLHLTMNDFTIHRIIGRGGFGEVYGSRKTDTGTMYAMKCLDKKRIKMKHGETLSLNERHMLQMVDSPFIVCISYAFQTTDKLCFILDLMNGGDLHYHLTQRGAFSEDELRFYACQILLGLGHMHSRDIVYRDLKPANILLDEKGHAKISDLGLACDLSKKKPHASVGTHGYIAPEVLTRGAAYDQGADWFSYGCTLFKLLRGHSPFRALSKTTDKAEIDKLTLTAEVKMPESFSKEVSSLIKDLLTKDPRQRLGCRGRGAEEVKEASFFKDIDWSLVERSKIIPPIVPPRGEVNAADVFDIGSFDDDETKGIKLSEDDQKLYKDFDLIVSSRWQKEICDTIFDMVNHETDKNEAKQRSKKKILQPGEANLFMESHNDNVLLIAENLQGDCVLHGCMYKLSWQLGITTWPKRYFYLFPNRLEWRDHDNSKSLVVFESVTKVREGSYKGLKHCMFITHKDSSKEIVIRCETLPEFEQWSQDLMQTWRQAKRLLKAGPKSMSVQRAGMDDPNFKAMLAAQTRSVDGNSNGPSYRHVLEPDIGSKLENLHLSD